MPNRIDDKVIIEDVLRVIEETGDISFKNYKKHGKYCESTFRAHFKTWHSLLKDLGITPEYNFKVSKEEIIEDVKKVFAETNNTTKENYLKYGKYSRSPIVRVFGSWNNLLKELNIKLNIKNDYTKDQILKDYISLSQEKRKPLSAKEFRKYYSESIINTVFGSFSNMRKELNIAIDARFVSDQDVLDDLKRLYNIHNHISYQIISNYCIVSFPTIQSRFQSLENACKLANIPYSKIDNMSKLCKFVLNVCEDQLGKNYVIEQTFDWLRNPKTNHNLYIDIYYPELNLAIEVDGKQHYDFVPLFHNNIEDLHESQERDKIKAEFLKEHNIDLIRFKYNARCKDIIKTLSQYLQSRE